MEASEMRARVEHMVDDGIPLEVVQLGVELSDLEPEERAVLQLWAWAWWMTRPRSFWERLAALWPRPRLRLR